MQSVREIPDDPNDVIRDPFEKEVKDRIQDAPNNRIQDRLGGKLSDKKKVLQDRLYSDLAPYDHSGPTDSEVLRDRHHNRDTITDRHRHPLDKPHERHLQEPKLPKDKPKSKIPDAGLLGLIFVDEPLPLPGVTQIGDSGFFISQDSPADPRNCDRWPDSPYCGGIPWSHEPIGLDPSIVIDECTIGFRITPIIGFTKAPPIEIQWRKPECRKRERESPLPPPELPPNQPPKMENFPDDIPFDEVVHAFVSTKGRTTAFGLFTYKDAWNAKWTEAYCPGKRYRRYSPIEGQPYQEIDTIVSGKGTYVQTGDTPEEHEFEDYNYFYIPDEQVSIADDAGNYLGQVSLFGTTRYYFFPSTYNHMGGYQIIYGKYGLIKIYCEGMLNDAYKNGNYIIGGDDVIVPYGATFSGVVSLDALFTVGCQQLVYPKPSPPAEPDDIIPPPPPLPPCRCMRCCTGGQNEDSDLIPLLLLILQRISEVKKDVEDIHAGIGVDEFPAPVPTLFTRREAGITEIQNLAHFNSHVLRQLDALCGAFPIKVQIKDIDATKSGNQSVTLEFPNVAETLAEIAGMMLTLKRDTTTISSAAIRNLVETGSAKQIAYLAYQYAKENADFLGYKGKQKTDKVPFSFTPGKKKLSELLQESVIDVKSWENIDSQDLADYFAPLLELAARWNAANWRKTPANVSPKQILDMLKSGLEITEKITEGKLKPENQNDDSEDNNKESWENFLEQAETGFITQSGISDTQKPYGREYDRRPRIRELGDTSEVEGNQ